MFIVDWLIWFFEEHPIIGFILLLAASAAPGWAIGTYAPTYIVITTLVAVAALASWIITTSIKYPNK